MERSAHMPAVKMLHVVFGSLLLLLTQLGARPINPSQLEQRVPQVLVNGAQVSAPTSSTGTTQGTSSPDLPVLERIRRSITDWEPASALLYSQGRPAFSVAWQRT